MKNPFRNKSLKTKKQDLFPSQDPIREPWNREPKVASAAPANKTVVGKKPDKPYLDQKSEPPPKKSKTKPTTPFSNLNFKKFSNSKKFSLINESAPEMSISADLGEISEVTLGREALDPDNPSISNEGHIQLRIDDGAWFVKNVSSNGATFIQALNYQPLTEGARIILGHRIFKFSSKQTPSPQSTGNKTMPLGGFDMSQSANEAIFLMDEARNKTISFTGTSVILKRSNTDPKEPSISSEQHASLENRQGNWMIVDRSSNQATFVQIENEVFLQDKMRLILGNKVFRFEIQ